VTKNTSGGVIKNEFLRSDQKYIRRSDQKRSWGVIQNEILGVTKNISGGVIKNEVGE
jgi:hypothetical protein